MEEMHIYDIDFLYGCSQPTIVLLHEDVHGRHVKTHEISLKDRDLVKVCYLGSVLELNKIAKISIENYSIYHFKSRFRGNKTTLNVKLHS